MIDSERAKSVRGLVAKGEKPLVSFLMMTYNQEKYIADAIDSAFSQTYSPLEIVISDDCSSDRTWEIIQRKVSAYAGPHAVITNRNLVNLGVTRNMGKLVSLCHGYFLSGCSGDDVAMPNRTQVLVDRWAKDDYRPVICWTNMYWMEGDGTKGGLVFSFPRKPQSRTEFLKSPAACIPGASVGLSADIGDIFGPINPLHSSSEDNARGIRGALIDHLVYIDEPTLYWRKVGLWSGMEGHPEFAKRNYYDGMVRAESIARQALEDALTLRDNEAIKAMCGWWSECVFRHEIMDHSLFTLPIRYWAAWRVGAKFWHLARWTYHAIRYRIRYTWHDALLGSKINQAEWGEREEIYVCERK